MTTQLNTGPSTAHVTGRPLHGQTALVSGGATGIGAEIAQALAGAGAVVAINHLQQHEYAVRLTAVTSNRGGSVVAFEADLRDPDAVATMYTQITDRIGPIDILVNNAGDYPRIAWTDLDEARWSNAIESNLTIHYRLTRACTPTMIRRRHGRIINIGSVAATAGRAGLVAYATAKAGLDGFTRSLARELGPHRICVNTISPGAIQVDRENELLDHHRNPVPIQLARQCIPRRGQPHDVAAAVVFLAGPAASFITGQSLHIDGGWILH